MFKGTPGPLKMILERCALDTPTHGLIGRLVARAIWPEKAQSGLVNVVTVCSLLPDLDVLVPGGGLEYLVSHRGISHSFIGVGVFAWGVAWVARKMGVRSHSFAQVYAASLLGFLSHVFFDMVTTFGTLVFAPFTDTRVAWDALFIIDPYLNALLIGSLCFGWLTRFGPAGYRFGAGLVSGYVVLALLITGVGQIQLRNWADAHDMVIDQMAVMPTPFSPLHRRGIVQSADRIVWVPMTFGAGVIGPAHTFTSALTDSRLGSVWSSRSGEIYKWFTRFPVVRQMDAKENMLLVQDLQFMLIRDDLALGWLGDWVARWAENRFPGLIDRRNFSLEIELSKEGRVKKVTYLGQTEERHPL